MQRISITRWAKSTCVKLLPQWKKIGYVSCESLCRNKQSEVFFYFKRSKLPFIWHLIGFYFHKRRTFLKNTWRITLIILIAQVSRCNKTGDKNVSNNNTVFFLIYHCVKFIVTSIFVLSGDSAERPMQHGNPLNEEFKNNFRNSLKPTTKKICRENNGSSSLHWLQLIEVTVFYFVCWLWYGSSFPLISTSV